VDGDDHVGAHFADDIGGEIVDHAAVDEDFFALADGSEDAGNGNGGAHGFGERAALEDIGLAGNEFRGNAAEGDGEIVEGRNAGVVDDFAVDEEIDLVAGVEPGRKRGATFQADLDGIGDGPGVFLAAEREVFVRRAAAEKERPICGAEDFLKLSRGLAGGVEAADKSAHAGAGEVVDGDVVLFKPFEDADVGFAERAAAFERDADFGASGGLRFCFGDGGGLLGRCGRLLSEARTRQEEREKRGE